MIDHYLLMDKIIDQLDSEPLTYMELLEIEQDLHSTGDCDEQCSLCREELIYDIEEDLLPEMIHDNLREYHLKNHRISLGYPHMFFTICEYCREELHIMIYLGREKGEN